MSSFDTKKFIHNALNPSEGESTIPDLHKLIEPHLKSYNNIFDQDLLDIAIQNIEHRYAIDLDGNRIKFWVEDVKVTKPMLSEKESMSIERRLYPKECRERGISYQGKLSCRLFWSINDGPIQSEEKSMGYIPVAIKSNRCHLEGLSPKELLKHGEDSEEFGGYFIINGIEKLIRLLIVPRRNHPMAIFRNSLSKRGSSYSNFGIQIRCSRPDESSQTIHLHYMLNGGIMLRFFYHKMEFLLPFILVLRALEDITDKRIYDMLISNNALGSIDTNLSRIIEAMLREFHIQSLYTSKDCKSLIGAKFRVIFSSDMGDTSHLSDELVGKEFLRKLILVHLEKNIDKQALLLLMAKKLFSLALGQSIPDNPDSPMYQEVLLPGHLYNLIIKQKIEEWLNSITIAIAIDHSKAKRNLSSTASVSFAKDSPYWKKISSKSASTIGKKLEYFVATGNLNSAIYMDLMQFTGFTIVAERLNFLRYLAHFRSIHRGAFFAELKTTSVRKLQPEAWGFLCPVHTPDGSPCGLLNHLSHSCIVTNTCSAVQSDQSEGIEQVCATLGLASIHESFISNEIIDSNSNSKSTLFNSSPSPSFINDSLVPIVLDGRWIGQVKSSGLEEMAMTLRHLKATKDPRLPKDLEIAMIPKSIKGPFPGLFLFTSASRMMRPVRYLPNNQIILIGSMEQVYLDIAIEESEIQSPDILFVEASKTNFLSVIANLVPFCDFNQSPRNMYQCQMGKQSMGTPFHNYDRRVDNKVYRLNTPQVPIVRTQAWNKYGFDSFPNGINAVVAVISYTGYDMEDAMILNKSAFERGFAHGTLYKCEEYEIASENIRGEPLVNFFGTEKELSSNSNSKSASNSANSTSIASNLQSAWKSSIAPLIESDGLPAVGDRVSPDDPIYSIFNELTGKTKFERFKSFESGWVDQVRLLGNDDNSNCPLQKISIKYRLPRNPIIGDKFASRHGQKGVCSFLYPMIDMPFTESGMTPDIIINPHAFPSRMTIGMFIESMAGKSGAIYGMAQDATPFQFGEEQFASEYFGEQLKVAGFDYYGNEKMYSGITGEELSCEIYVGVVYYQRLRHMVTDKFQVRTIGPVHNITKQPIKGRQRAGGIRFGEMERDSLLAHGASFLLQDRLLNCSDYSKAWICEPCGSLLSPIAQPDGNVKCLKCSGETSNKQVAIPFVFRYLVAELAAMNVGVKIELTS